MAQNVFDYILEHSRGDEGYEPHGNSSKTTARPGSKEKIAILSRRLVRGGPLWHPRDRNCFAEGGPC